MSERHSYSEDIDILRERLSLLKRALAGHDDASSKMPSAPSSLLRETETEAPEEEAAAAAREPALAEAESAGQTVQDDLPRTAPGIAPAQGQPDTAEGQRQAEHADGERQVDRARLAQEVARLFNLASLPSSAITVQERALVLDLLALRLRDVGESLLAVALERVRAMENPPRGLLAVLLERCRGEECAHLLMQARLPTDMQEALAETSEERVQMALARRKELVSCVTCRLLATAPASVVAALLGNAGAAFDDACWTLLLRRLGAWTEAERALAGRALAARENVPGHVGLAAFWWLDAATREALLKRFCSDSGAAEEILALAGLRLAGTEDFLRRMLVALGALSEGDWRQAANVLAEGTSLHSSLLRRILRDAGGEPLALLLKAHGARSRDIASLLEMMRQHRLARRWAFLERAEELVALHDAFGVNHARMVLVYWDWHSRGIGPCRECPMPDAA